MHTPPQDLELGDRLTQEEIEQAFDTGFGYRISGINPRRDHNNNRYLLIFANEDGPYSDSVRQGQFEYIGEGLRGDQNEDSPGNSVLIDAILADFPVYFFYKRQDRTGWEYQGEIDVQSYRREEQGGREVLIFTMQHRDPSDAEDCGLYLIPVNDEWRDRFRNSVEEPHDLRQYGELPSQLEGIARLRMWGTTETDAQKKRSAIDKMEPDDYVLFYYQGRFFCGGIVSRTFENADVGKLLWNNPESRHLFTIDEFTYNVPGVDRVWTLLGYDGRQVVQGFTRVADERAVSVRQEHGSLASVLFASEPTISEVEDQKSKLKKAVEQAPELTEDETQYVETRRRARDRAFTELIREAYDNTCAVCGCQRESPSGNPEVEAAHIYPVSEGGRNDVRNGIALCKFHHWAFDTGWLSVTDSHEIMVTEAPDKNGHYEFKQLEGQSLHLPDDAELYPHLLFLEQHWAIHGFER
ncbi:HNH endonuclease [Halalkalirubrum salinum]|uniref:HNH endonuclease n=1 Tax=Halalkalirubrum salinum TaxID=2563889 RepID=UPI0010FAE239|nr:HNH endonuclease [Halalkalirubrum salinum]